MVIEIHQLLGYGKGVAASTIKNFYQQKTNPRSKMIEAIQEWDNKEKKKEVESEDYEEDNKNNEDTNINNSSSTYTWSWNETILTFLDGQNGQN